MRTTLITAPVTEPLTLAETKEHLRVDFTDEDTLITNLITSARQRFEADTGRQLITATWRGFLDRFPSFADESIEVAKPPLLSVASILYIDSSGISQTWDSSEYDVQVFAGPRAQRGMISLTPDFCFPTIRRVPNAITINYDGGYGPNASDVPQDIKQSLFAWIGHVYRNRELYITGMTVSKVPGLGFDEWEEIEVA